MITAINTKTLVCKTCNVERDKNYFISSLINNKRYYNKKKCKVCKGIKIKTSNEIKIKSNDIISKECLEFLEELKINKRYYCDLVDSYKIAHYFTEVFGETKLDVLDVEEQLEIMVKELLKEKNKL